MRIVLLLICLSLQAAESQRNTSIVPNSAEYFDTFIKPQIKGGYQKIYDEYQAHTAMYLSFRPNLSYDQVWQTFIKRSHEYFMHVKGVKIPHEGLTEENKKRLEATESIERVIGSWLVFPKDTRETSRVYTKEQIKTLASRIGGYDALKNTYPYKNFEETLTSGSLNYAQVSTAINTFVEEQSTCVTANRARAAFRNVQRSIFKQLGDSTVQLAEESESKLPSSVVDSFNAETFKQSLEPLLADLSLSICELHGWKRIVDKRKKTNF